MIAAVVVYVLIVTLPLIGAAALTERAFRLWSWPVRGVWALTLVATVLLSARAVVHQLTPSHAPLQITSIHATLGVAAPAAGVLEDVTRFANGLMSFPRSIAGDVAHAAGPSQDRILVALWCVASITMLAFICFVYARVWSERLRWQLAEFGGQRVHVAPHAGPAVVGLFRPEIVVPRWMLESEPEVRGLVVMHEAEHRNARDPLLLAAMWALVALIPWHPGAWYCLARTRLGVELDCDARVIRRGAPLRAYAQLLINQARVRLAAPIHVWLGATSLLEPSSHLERRLTAMIHPDHNSSAPEPLVRFLRTASLFAVASTVAFAACESHVPTAADISGLDAASAEVNARKASIFDGQPVTFYVNNARVSSDSAHAIAASAIRTVTIMKNGSQQVRIMTVPAAGGDSLAAADQPGQMLRRHFEPGTSPEQSGTPGKRMQAFAGVVVIDGVTSDVAALKSLDPSRIATIEVIKGPAAMQQSSDPRARDGIIRITLKH